jgi:N-acetylmuramoyl-L-alanine amidase CwlA
VVINLTTIVQEIINEAGYSIQEAYIHPSQWVRTQVMITPRGGIIHWTGNISAGANDRANRTFFDGRKGTYGSAHLIGDMDSILAALPYMPNDAELAYHVGATVYETAHFGSYPNNCTLGYEMCVNMDGNFRESYKRAVWTMAYLSSVYNWNPQEDVMRHNDITGKDCPLPFLDLIHNDNHCLSIGWSSTDTQWMRNNLHIDGVQGEALWQKYKQDVTELHEILENGGIQMIQDLKNQMQQLQNKVAELEKTIGNEGLADWSNPSVQKALQVAQKHGQSFDVNEGTHDFHRVMAILDRMGILDMALKG